MKDAHTHRRTSSPQGSATVIAGTRSGTATVVAALSALARFGLAAVWIISGFSKIGDSFTMRQSVAAYELFDRGMINLIAATLPPLEIALGVAVLLGLFQRVAAAVSVVMFLAFIAGIASAWARGLSIDCGCFGTGGADASVTARTYAWEIVRDSVFVVMAVWVVVRPFVPLSIITLGRRR